MASVGVEEGSVDPFDVGVGLRIRARRKMLGMTQEALAERLGIAAQQIQRYERGVGRLAGARLLALAKAMKTTVGWLLGEATGDAENEAVFAALTLPGALEMLMAFVAIGDPASRAALLGVARDLAARES